jgi:hypothetical protein
VLLDSRRYIDAALKAARALARVQRADGWLAGTYDAQWHSRARYCCLTGVAQMSIDWMRCAQAASAVELQNNAGQGIAFLKRRQRLEDGDEVARGAIAGSTPIWGAYSRFEFPNWAAKFFADALMMDLDHRVVPPVLELSRSTHGNAVHV